MIRFSTGSNSISQYLPTLYFVGTYKTFPVIQLSSIIFPSSRTIKATLEPWYYIESFQKRIECTIYFDIPLFNSTLCRILQDRSEYIFNTLSSSALTIIVLPFDTMHITRFRLAFVHVYIHFK